ncbi:enoyl-CoA hydratase/isomerase family protein [Alkaliphilus transvaalensis]|uniref:enoyl-CoA hydratase/isomerase family protein n=1 Tax=Alkaliphilus transvaalensis TaxID=114628 RepID=UPI000478689F|nr:enoyl-CoA hydratase/isomerase family protein [Alkaliphilus transvaalensis]
MNENTLQFEMVKLKMEDQIAIMTLCNGKQNKIINAEFLELEVFKNWLQEMKPIGLIICGEGRHFSAGADLEEIEKYKNTPEPLKERLNKGKIILDFIERLPIVTVAAISGMCCGGGLEIALSCQFRVSTSNSIFSFPEGTIGLLPGLGGTIRLPKLIGKSKAIKMIMSGENYIASEALEMGLVDLVVDKNKHLIEAKKFIENLSSKKSYFQINSIISSINNNSIEHETEMFIEHIKLKDFKAI